MEPEVTSDGVIDRIAVACGTTAPAVRLLISILLGECIRICRLHNRIRRSTSIGVSLQIKLVRLNFSVLVSVMDNKI